MRYELTDFEWAAIRSFLPNKPRGIPRVDRPARPERHLLGIALRRSLARSAGDLWSPHHLLQSLRSVAAGWRLGPDCKFARNTDPLRGDIASNSDPP
jgi:hypothetical protein